MAKWQNDAVLDAALTYISTNATELYICSEQPISRAAAIASSLTAVAVPTFQANSDGITSGRKLTVDQKADIAITANGSANHVVLCSGADLVYITTCTPKALTIGDTTTQPQWNIEFADVTP